MSVEIEDLYSFDPVSLAKASESHPEHIGSVVEAGLTSLESESQSSAKDTAQVRDTSALNGSSVHLFAAALRGAGLGSPDSCSVPTDSVGDTCLPETISDAQASAKVNARVRDTSALNGSSVHLFAAALREAGQRGPRSPTSPLTNEEDGPQASSPPHVPSRREHVSPTVAEPIIVSDSDSDSVGAPHEDADTGKEVSSPAVPTRSLETASAGLQVVPASAMIFAATMRGVVADAAGRANMGSASEAQSAKSPMQDSLANPSDVESPASPVTKSPSRWRKKESQQATGKCGDESQSPDKEQVELIMSKSPGETPPSAPTSATLASSESQAVPASAVVFAAAVRGVVASASGRQSLKSTSAMSEKSTSTECSPTPPDAVGSRSSQTPECRDLGHDSIQTRPRTWPAGAAPGCGYGHSLLAGGDQSNQSSIGAAPCLESGARQPNRQVFIKEDGKSAQGARQSPTKKKVWQPKQVQAAV